MTPKAARSGQGRPFWGNHSCALRKLASTLPAYGVMVTRRALCVTKVNQVSESSSKVSSVSWGFLQLKGLGNTLYFFYGYCSQFVLASKSRNFQQFSLTPTHFIFQHWAHIPVEPLAHQIWTSTVVCLFFFLRELSENRLNVFRHT